MKSNPVRFYLIAVSTILSIVILAIGFSLINGYAAGLKPNCALDRLIVKLHPGITNTALSTSVVNELVAQGVEGGILKIV